MTSRMDATIQGAFEVPEVFGDATTQLVLASVPMLRRAANRIVRQSADADDLVQETLLRAYHARDHFQPGTSVRAWTSTILRRLFLTGAIRDQRRGLQTDTDAGGALAGVVSRQSSLQDDPTPDVAAFSDGLDDTIKQALDRVPEVHRTPFFLSVVWDLSCAEIGRRLSVPVGTVMSRVHRARERLRGDLSQHRRRFPAAIARSSR